MVVRCQFAEEAGNRNLDPTGPALAPPDVLVNRAPSLAESGWRPRRGFRSAAFRTMMIGAFYHNHPSMQTGFVATGRDHQTGHGPVKACEFGNSLVLCYNRKRAGG